MMSAPSAIARNVAAEPPWRPSPSLVPPRADVVGAMRDMLRSHQPVSDAEALRLLRRAFPDFPLGARLMALAVQGRRREAP